MVKYLIRIALMFLATLFVSSGVPHSASADPLVITISETYPPFTQIDINGQPAGMFVDIWNLWAKKTGSEVAFQASDWVGTLAALKKGNADIHSGLYFSDKRDQWMDYSQAFYTNRSSFYHRIDESAPPSDATMEGVKIGVIKGYLQETFLKEAYAKAEITTLANDRELIKALASGTIDLFLSEDPTIEALLAETGMLGRIGNVGGAVQTNDLYASVLGGRADLLKLINDGFERIMPAEWAAIEARWIKDPSKRVFGNDQSNHIGLSTQEKAWIAANPVIHSIAVTDWPPVEFQNSEGELTGIAADILRLAAKRAGLKVEPQFGPWKEMLKKLQQGEIDLAPDIFHTEERANFLAYTRPHLPIYNAIFVGPKGRSVKGVDDLTDKKVAVEKGYSMGGVLKSEYPGIHLIMVDSTLDALKLVSVGEVDAYIGSQYVASYLISQNLLYGVKPVARFGDKPDFLHMAVPKDRTILRDIMDKALGSISESEKRTIIGRYVVSAVSMASGSAATELIDLTDEENDWLMANPVWRVANETDWPPFDFAINGEPQGYAIDIINLVARNVGAKLKYVNGFSWSELLKKFKAGDLDILPAVIKTQDRLSFISFTEGYATNPSVLVTHSSNTEMSHISDLDGKTVAIIQGYAVGNIIERRYPNIKTKLVKDVREGLQAVSAKKIDAFVGSLGAISYVVEQNYIPNIKIAGDSGLKSIDETKLHVGVASDKVIFRNIIQKGLNSITNEEKQRVRNQWISVIKTNKPQVDLTLKERSWLARNSHFRLGIDTSWAPFEYLDDDGNYSGIGSSYVQIISERLGITATPEKVLSWARVIEKAKLGELDILPAVVRSAEREKFLIFTDPYVSFPMVIATRKDAPFVDSLAGLYGKRVGVVKGYITQELIEKNHKDILITPVKSLIEGLNYLNDGRIDAFVDNLATITHEIDKSHLDDLKIAAATQYRFELAMGVRKDLPELVPILNKALKTISKRERAAIVNSWTAIRVQYGADVKTVLIWGVPIGSVVVVVFVIGFYINRRMSHEISQRKIIESQLGNEKETLEAVMDTVDYGILFMDPDLNASIMNRAYRSLWQINDEVAASEPTLEDLIRFNQGKGFYDVADEDFDEFVRSRVESIRKGDVPPTDVRQPNGRILQYQCLALPDGRRMLTYLDITERKKAEKLLAEERRRLQSILDTSPIGVGISRDGKFHFTNPKFTDMLDLREGDSSFDNYVNPDDRTRLLERFETVGLVENIEMQMYGHQSEVREILASFLPTEFEGEEAILGWLVDITERKQSEQKLAEKEAQLSLALDNMSDGMFLMGKDENYILINERYKEMTQLPPDLLSVGKSVRKVVEYLVSLQGFPTLESEKAVDERMEQLSGSQPARMEVHIPDGPILELRNAPASDVGTVVVATDLTERVQQQERLTDALNVISGSIEYASKIQRSVLPDDTLFSSLLSDHMVLWEPRDVVGGDIYWCRLWGEGLLIILGDCTGHGVPGAFMTLIATGALDNALTDVPQGQVGQLLQRIHQMVQTTLGQHGEGGESDDGMELGMCYLGPAMDELTFTGARFELYQVEDGEIDVIKGTKSGIGYRGISHTQEFEEHQIVNLENKTFFMTSDGLVDQVGGDKRRMFGKRRFRELLLNLRNKTMAEHKKHIYRALIDYQGEERRRDDISIIGFKV